MSATTAPVWTHAKLQARLQRSSFNEWLGLELVSWDAAGITLAMRCRPEILGHKKLGALHGGIVAALVDTGCSMAVVARTGESVFTVDLRVDFLRPATADAYRVRAEVLRLGRTLATVDARVTTVDDRLVASGRAVLQHIAQLGD
jgi:uncharacterized protein (TIGR00369 family)